MLFQGKVAPRGNLHIIAVDMPPMTRVSWRWRLRNMARWGWLKSWLAVTVMAPLARLAGFATAIGELRIIANHADGRRVDYGVVGRRVVTNAGVAFIVDAFTGTATLSNMNYHGVGTTNTAEAAGDTALAAECTTVLTVDSTRATGAQTQPSANIYQSQATITFDGAASVVEHGLFDQAATGGGTLLDRTVFAVISAGPTVSIQATYQITLTAGS